MIVKYSVSRWGMWLCCRASDFRSSGPGFESYPYFESYETSITPLCLCLSSSLAVIDQLFMEYLINQTNTQNFIS